MGQTNEYTQQNYVSVPIITSSLIGVLIFWAIKQILEKKNIENTARILSDNFERSHDLQIKELKEDMKVLQGQIEAKIDIIEQKNVHINLINKEFHTLQKNYNRLKKESIFLKDQLHNAQLDIVEFEQENVNLVNQLNEALQHINSLDQIIESEKSTDQSVSRIEDDFNVQDAAPSTATTSHDNFSEIIAAESTKNSIPRKASLVPTRKNHHSQKSHTLENVYKRNFIPRADFYDDDDAASVTESDSNIVQKAIAKKTKAQTNKRDSVNSNKAPIKQAQFLNDDDDDKNITNDNYDLDQPVEKKQVANGNESDFEEDLRSFPSNIIYDDNIITNANPPSPMKYDLKSHHYKGHNKTESTFSHKSYKSGKSSKSASSKVIINPENGSEIMVQGPTNLKRNKSAGKSFGIFNFASKNNKLNFNTPEEPIITNAVPSANVYHNSTEDTDNEKFDDFKYKWVSELEYLKSTVKNLKAETSETLDIQPNKTNESLGIKNNSTDKLTHELDDIEDKFQNATLFYDQDEYQKSLNDTPNEDFNENKKSINSLDAEKETKKVDDFDNESDVLMVDHKKGVIYNKEYNSSSNLIPKFSKTGKFNFKRKSGDKNSMERRAFSSTLS